MQLYEKRQRRQRLAILSIFAFLAAGLAFLLVAHAKTRYGAPGEPTELSWEPIVMAADVTMEAWTQPEETAVPEYPEFSYSKDWDANDSYLLAKIAMAKAEGESTEGKALVILVVLNRVCSGDFPNTIREVIYQDRQFMPIANGRFDAVEPDADCWAALESVMTAQYDCSEGALYFESCESTDTWHSRNLEFLYQVGNHKFYK